MAQQASQQAQSAQKGNVSSLDNVIEGVTKAATDPVIQINIPDSEEVVSYNVKAGGVYALNFEVSDARISQEGDDLIFTFENEASVTLVDFFEFLTGEQFQLILADGSTLLATQFLEIMQALGELDDIRPAEGLQGNTGADFDSADFGSDLPGSREIGDGGVISSFGDFNGGGRDDQQLVFVNDDTPPAGDTFNPLFTENDDIVDFNLLTVGDYTDGTQYNGLDGDDTVYLPQDEEAANQAGYVIGSVFSAGAGNDTVYGGSLDDNINGNDGRDTLHGGDGNDTLSGGEGRDTLYGDAGDDILDGGNGVDTLYGGSGNDSLSGGAGNDYLGGGEGNDALNGGAGEDWLQGGSGDDVLDGGDGDDLLEGGAGDDTLQGGAGNDNLRGDEGNDLLLGGDGDDVLQGGEGDDLLLGGDGNDYLVGGRGVDVLYGGAGNDTLAYSADDFWNAAGGSDGNPFVDRGDMAPIQTYNFNDSIEEYYSTFFSLAADFDFANLADINITFDQYNGGEGYDTVVGTNGADLFLYQFLIGPDGTLQGSEFWGDIPFFADNYDFTDPRFISVEQFNLGAGDDIFNFTTTDGYQYLLGDLVVNGGLGNDIIWLNSGSDLVYGGEGNDWIDGGAGNDEIHGGAGNDLLFGGAGDDLIFGNEGDDEIAGGDGDDNLWGGDGNDIILGDDGNDEMYGGAGDDFMRGGADDDVLHGQDGNDTLWGDSGNDVLYGGAGNDNLDGDAGNDTIFGGTGNDIIWGGTGDDTIYGGEGSDSMMGGSGADTFVWSAGDLNDGAVDHITDFNAAEGDTLDVSALLQNFNGDISQYLQYIELPDGTTMVQIDIDGAGGDYGWIDLAILGEPSPALIQDGEGGANLGDMAVDVSSVQAQEVSLDSLTSVG